MSYVTPVQGSAAAARTCECEAAPHGACCSCALSLCQTSPHTSKSTLLHLDLISSDNYSISTLPHKPTHAHHRAHRHTRARAGKHVTQACHGVCATLKKSHRSSNLTHPNEKIILLRIHFSFHPKKHIRERIACRANHAQDPGCRVRQARKQPGCTPPAPPLLPKPYSSSLGSCCFVLVWEGRL
jgi:hypothetical protein